MVIDLRDGGRAREREKAGPLPPLRSPPVKSVALELCWRQSLINWLSAHLKCESDPPAASSFHSPRSFPCVGETTPPHHRHPQTYHPHHQRACVYWVCEVTHIHTHTRKRSHKRLLRCSRHAAYPAPRQRGIFLGCGVGAVVVGSVSGVCLVGTARIRGLARLQTQIMQADFSSLEGQPAHFTHTDVCLSHWCVAVLYY